MKYQINVICTSEEERQELKKLLTLLKLEKGKERAEALVEVLKKELK